MPPALPPSCPLCARPAPYVQVKALALKVALSDKYRSGQLVLVQSYALAEAKAKLLHAALADGGLGLRVGTQRGKDAAGGALAPSLLFLRRGCRPRCAPGRRAAEPGPPSARPTRAHRCSGGCRRPPLIAPAPPPIVPALASYALSPPSTSVGAPHCPAPPSARMPRPALLLHGGAAERGAAGENVQDTVERAASNLPKVLARAADKVRAAAAAAARAAAAEPPLAPAILFHSFSERHLAPRRRCQPSGQ